MPQFNLTIPAYKSRPLPSRWKYFFCTSCLAGSTEATIKGIAEQDNFDVKTRVEIIEADEVDGLTLRNDTGSSVVVTGFYGLRRYSNRSVTGESVSISSIPNVDIDSLPPVEIAANDTVSVSADASVATTDKEDFAAPANAKGAIVTLVTSGFTFGEVRVSGSNTYAAATGVPLPVGGASIYIDSGDDLTIHNANGATAADVNITWIS